jgi:5'-nucleotidase
MYADILRSKRTLGWRTCLIIPELTSEIMTYKRRRADRSELLALRREQFVLETRLDKVKSATSPELAGVHAAKGTAVLPVGTVAKTATTSADLLDEIKILEERIAFLKASIREKLEAYNSAFHPEWGPLFKAGFQESRFALQINDYACMYTSRASNLGLVSPQRPFRPVRDKMPHDHYLEGL